MSWHYKSQQLLINILIENIAKFHTDLKKNVIPNSATTKTNN